MPPPPRSQDLLADGTPAFDLAELRSRPIGTLHAASSRGDVTKDHPADPTRGQMVMASLTASLPAGAVGVGGGHLDIRPEGFGFLRAEDGDGRSDADDVFVSTNQIRRLLLRPGQAIVGSVRLPRDGERYLAMLRIDAVDGVPIPEEGWAPPLGFQHAVSVQPDRALPLRAAAAESDAATRTWLRLVDLLAPLGHGQRVVVWTPPEDRLLRPLLALAKAATPDSAHLLAVLLDQAPEARTDARRLLAHHPRATVWATELDEPAPRHLELMEWASHRARRLIEAGDDVVLLVDSMTHGIRAAQAALPHSGKTLRAGLNTTALHAGLRLLGLARQTEGGPALTVITGVSTSARDDDVAGVIAAELRGRASAEIAMDLTDELGKSGTADLIARFDPRRTRTRDEAQLRPPAQRARLRTLLAELEAGPEPLRDALLHRLAATPDNETLLGDG